MVDIAPRANSNSASFAAMLAIFTAALALYFWAFWPSLKTLTGIWAAKEEFSHGYFIPLVSVWMIYERRASLGAFGRQTSWAWLPVIGLAGLMLVLGQMTFIWTASYLGFVIGLFAFPLAFGGRALTAAVFVPLLFLCFMIPTPPFLTYLLTAEMQLLSSKIGVFLIRSMGMPVYLAGNVIDLGALKLEVVEACSGLRYLFPFLSLGFLAGYIFKGPWWQRLALFAATLPITIAMNSLRIALTAYMSERLGSSYAQGFSHFIEGWMVFLLCIAALLLLAWLFARLLNQRGLGEMLALPSVRSEDAGALRPVKAFAPLLFGAGLIAASSLYLAAPDMREPGRRSLINLPFELAGWRYLNTQTLSTEVEETLDADDYVIANFAGEDDALFNLYIAYLSAQDSTNSWHSPRQCLPSGGWDIRSFESHRLDFAARGTVSVKRAIITKEDEQLLVYFWFDQRGRVMTGELMVKYYLLVDTLTQQRSDGAMVRLITKIKPGEAIAAADKRLANFAYDVTEALPPFVPH